MKTIAISELRSHLKEVLDLVKEGKVVEITQRGKVIATLNPPQLDNDEEAFQERLESYKYGGIIINGDIVDSPLKEYDYVSDDDYLDVSIAAEPDA